MPWPINKIVKWVTKQVVRFVTKVEEILVEVILQSETEAISKGDYKEGNNVTLNGNIYYGSNVPVTIIIDENGNISGVQGLEYVKGSISKTITLKNFASAAVGSLNITSYFGRVAGNVVVYTNSMISELSIFNNSDYHLIINDLSLLSNSEAVSGNYNIHCSVMSFSTATMQTFIIVTPSWICVNYFIFFHLSKLNS